MTILERDPETGQITKAELSTAEAKRRGAMSHDKKVNGKAGKLLLEAGYDEDNQAPFHLAVIAEYAVSGKSGAVSAMRDFRRLTNPGVDIDSMISLQAGETCPACGQRRDEDFVTDNDRDATYHRIVSFRDVSQEEEQGDSSASKGQQQPPSSG
ncbi:MAG: hypothetical protein ACYSW6_11325 [Planctomycetota bacterium]